MRPFRDAVAVVVLSYGALLLAATGQGGSAVERAKRVVDHLVREQFEDVAREFNDKMAAALSAAQLRDVWSQVRQQTGSFVSILDERVAAQSEVIVVTIGCQFEKAAVNVVVAYDANSRIGGLRIVPRPAPNEPQLAPSSTKFKDEPVTVGTGAWTLPGTVSMPVGPIAGALVLVHGSGPHDRDETIGPNKPFRDLAWGLADRGIAVLRYEKRTRQYPGKIAGAAAYTVRDEVIEDALAAAALLRTRERIDPKRVFVLGHSLGGMVAPRMAEEDRTLAGLVILAGPTRPLLDAAREQLAYLASLAPGTLEPEKALAALQRSAPESYWRDLDAHEPADVAKKLALPMLILQGERDYQVTMADLQGWKDALRDRPLVTFKSYPALNHLFLPGEGRSTPSEYQRPGRIPDFVLDDIAAWIASVK